MDNERNEGAIVAEVKLEDVATALYSLVHAAQTTGGILQELSKDQSLSESVRKKLSEAGGVLKGVKMGGGNDKTR